MNAIIFGIVGFIIGFVLGQGLLAMILKDKTKEELLHDPRLRDYGLITWACAIGFCALFVFLAKAMQG